MQSSLAKSRSVWLVQLPIPPLGPEPIRGNVPLVAGYLELWALKKRLGAFYDIHVLLAHEANTLSDRDLLLAVAQREPWMVGFTCYLGNIERTLWIARELKRAVPGVRIVMGGPEITAADRLVCHVTRWRDGSFHHGDLNVTLAT